MIALIIAVCFFGGICILEAIIIAILLDKITQNNSK
jgi:hypothetical protein